MRTEKQGGSSNSPFFLTLGFFLSFFLLPFDVFFLIVPRDSCRPIQRRICRRMNRRVATDFESLFSAIKERKKNKLENDILFNIFHGESLSRIRLLQLLQQLRSAPISSGIPLFYFILFYFSKKAI